METSEHWLPQGEGQRGQFGEGAGSQAWSSGTARRLGQKWLGRGLWTLGREVLEERKESLRGCEGVETNSV